MYNNCSNNIFDAVKEGDLTNIKQFVNKNNVNSVDKYNQTLLHHSSSNGNIKIVKYLIKTGADVNLKDDFNITPLLLAVFNNHEDMVYCLLKNQADPNIKGYSGLTALHFAAENGNIVNFTHLIEFGGNTRAVNDNESSVMHSVALGIINGNNKCWDLINVLRDKQIDPLAKNDMGKSARNLLEEHNFEYSNRYDYMLAERFTDNSNNGDINDKILSHLSNVLHSAISEENEELASILIEKEIGLRVKDNEGNTPLLLATVLDLTEITSKIINKLDKIDINAQNNEGKTALHFAAENNNLVLLKMLNSKGGNLNAIDNNRWTILHSATASLINEGDWEVIKWLLLQIFLKRNKEKDVANPSCSLSKHLEQIPSNDLLTYTSETILDVRDKYGNNLLHHAVRSGKTDIVEFLLTQEIDVDTQSNFGTTPLLIAVLNKNINLVNLLLQNEANPNLKNILFSTPISIAVELGEKEIFITLIKDNMIDIDKHQLFNCAAVGILEHNEKCWDIIEHLLKSTCFEEEYSEALTMLTEEHWLYANKFQSFIDTI